MSLTFTNSEVIEHLSDREQHDWAHFGKLRREWDRQFEDPDDVYLEAEQREEERRKQGLPPRFGIIPHAPIAAEETRLEADQGARKSAAGKPGGRGPMGESNTHIDLGIPQDLQLTVRNGDIGRGGGDPNCVPNP